MKRLILKIIKLIEYLKEQMLQIYNIIIDYNFSNILQDIRRSCKSNSKAIMIFFALIGFLTLVTRFTHIHNTTKFQENIPEKYYEQLPNDHWIKAENKGDPLLILKDFKNVLNVYSNTFTDLSIEMLGQTNFMGKLLSIKAKEMKKSEQKKYYLKIDENHKKIKKIHLKEGDQLTVSYYEDNQRLRFDFTKDEFIKSNSKILDIFVYSYIKDTNIATFFDGKIIGVKKGKTSLIISNGYNTSEYKIKVTPK